MLQEVKTGHTLVARTRSQILGEQLIALPLVALLVPENEGGEIGHPSEIEAPPALLPPPHHESVCPGAAEGWEGRGALEAGLDASDASGEE